MKLIRLTPPLSHETVRNLRAGDRVLITGSLYTARDAAHKRLVQILDKGEKLPFEIRGQIIYYVGPTPARPGKPIGSAGPTTSGRMDAYAPRLIAAGLKGMIGKGEMGPDVVKSIQEHGAVCFMAVGGAGALLAQAVTACNIIDYEDLGPEAIRRLEVVDFPVIVAQDSLGGNIYITKPVNTVV